MVERSWMRVWSVHAGLHSAPPGGAKQAAILPRRSKATSSHSFSMKEAFVTFTDAEDVDRTLRAVLADTLGLPTEKVNAFTEATPLFGALPEFDSMAVATLLTSLEERLGILIEDDDVDADMLETYGALLTFAKAKALR
jgi:acyl carrier protein